MPCSNSGREQVRRRLEQRHDRVGRRGPAPRRPSRSPSAAARAPLARSPSLGRPHGQERVGDGQRDRVDVAGQGQRLARPVQPSRWSCRAGAGTSPGRRRTAPPGRPPRSRCTSAAPRGGRRAGRRAGPARPARPRCAATARRARPGRAGTPRAGPAPLRPRRTRPAGRPRTPAPSRAGGSAPRRHRPRRPATCRPAWPAASSTSASGSSSSSAQMLSISSSRTGPAKTASRCSRRRSGFSSRSQLHSTTASRVRWRGSAVRLPPVSSRNRSSSRAGDLLGRHRPQPRGGQLDGQRQAVQPPADGDDGADGVGVDDEARAAPRWPGRRAAARRRRSGPASGVGTERRQAPAAAAGTAVSPVMPSGSRLVASSRTPGQAASTWSASSATAAIRCSQLSRTISSSAPARRLDQAVEGTRRLGRRRGCRPARSSSRRSRRPRADSTACGQVERVVHRGQLDQPDPAGQSRSSRCPVSRASRVLPAPPGPTRVTSRGSGAGPSHPLRPRPRGRRSWSGRSAGCRAGPASAPESVGPAAGSSAGVLAQHREVDLLQRRARGRRRARRRAGAGSGRTPRARRPAARRRTAPGQRPCRRSRSGWARARPRARPGRAPARAELGLGAVLGQRRAGAGPARPRPPAAYGGSPMSARAGPWNSAQPGPGRGLGRGAVGRGPGRRGPASARSSARRASTSLRSTRSW